MPELFDPVLDKVRVVDIKVVVKNNPEATIGPFLSLRSALKHWQALPEKGSVNQARVTDAEGNLVRRII